MEENVEPYSFDLNLDFLESATADMKNATITPVYQEQSQIHSTYDIESLASRIATVNDMAIQMKATEDDNFRLQKQMQELSESAMSIRSMYDQEKGERLKFATLYRELQEKYEQTESQLTNKTLNYEQLQSRIDLEAEDKKPISYRDLALKYQRLALLLDEEKQLPSKEKIILQLVKDYLESKKLSPLPLFKKKSHSRSKCEGRDFAMQYNFKAELKSQESQCSFGYSEEEPKDLCTQGTQYTWYTTTRGTNTPAFSNTKPELKNQGTQYISSTTTRGTSTSTFIKTQSVGTNFPEPVPPVSVEDIFKEMICDVSPLSPMSAGSQPELKEEKVEMKSIGTCTDLKNVRKPIDYVAANIKHSDSRPPSRNNNMYDRVKNEIPLMGMPTLNPFAGLGTPVTPMHNTVAELWNMLGHTIFALLQQNSGATGAQLNPIHMNVVNDRMRNLNGRNRPPSEQQRSCESQTRDDYFEQEYSREYPMTTRSTATSPILPTELQINEPQSTPSFKTALRTPNQPVDIPKIMLNKNFSEPVVSSSRKSSQVDEILQLFPEYSDSFKKRKAIKRLLKEANKNKKPKPKKIRNSTSCSSSSSASASTNFSTEVQTRAASSVSVSASPQPSMEMPQTKPHLQANWKTEIFGDCDSDSSLDSSIMDYIKAHTPQADPETKWTPIETKPPPNELNWPISSSSLEIKRNLIKSPVEEEFFGFDEETNLQPTSDEVFCKPFLPPNRPKSVILSDSSIQKIQERINVDPNMSGGLLNTKIEPNEESQPVKPPPKRKRRAKKTDSNQTNKIYKVDETPILPEPQTPAEIKKPKRSLSLNKTNGKVKTILPIQPTTCVSVNKPLRSLSLNKIKKPKQEPKEFVCVSQNQTSETPKKPGFNKPDWMNRTKDPNSGEELSIQVSRNQHGPMVMKVEKPPDSVFEDIKTCFSNQKQDAILQDIKTCFINPKQERDIKPFIGPIMPNQAAQNERVVHPEQSLPFVAPTEDGTFRFLLQPHQSTINTSLNSPINPVKSPENHFKILNYYEPSSTEDTREKNSKSSITILNEQWISQSNDLKATKQESPISIVTSDVSRPLDQITLDLENMPIYFLDDQNLLQNSEQPNEEKLRFETPQATPYQGQNVTILPGFQEIQQGLKTSPAQFIASSHNQFQKEKVQISRPDGPELNSLPVIVRDFPNSFQQNRLAMNTKESIPTVRDVKPMVTTLQDKTSYLVLNHQKQLNSCKESSICTRLEEKMEEELEVLSTRINFNEQENLNTNEKTDLLAFNPLNGKQFRDISRSMMSNDETDPTTQEGNPSKFFLQNQSLFSSKILGEKTTNEDPSWDGRQKVSEVFEMHSPTAAQPLSNNFLAQKAFKTPSLETKINNFETRLSVTEYQSQEKPLQDKLNPKSKILATTIEEDDLSYSSSSDSEGDLSIDFPPSPPPTNSSSLDLSAILKTPEQTDKPEVQFKTPARCPNNDSLITKAITNSTEKLVEEYLLNESPGEEGPKFQVFLDRILDDVAPPSSPVSALASSEKPTRSESESSCDEASSETTTPIQNKRRRAATAAIAVKRSARINAKKIEATTSMVNSLCSMTIPNIELGKYTKKKTEKQLVKQEKLVEPIKEEKFNIRMGFFQEAMHEEGEEPICEPIRRHSVEEFKAVDKNVLEEAGTAKRKPETEIVPNAVASRFNTSTEDYRKSSFPHEVDSYISLYKKAKESISLYLKAEESNRLPIPDSSGNSSSENYEEPSSFCYESPASPSPSDQIPDETHTIRESFELSPLPNEHMKSGRTTVISQIIANYNHKFHNMLDKGQKFNTKLLAQLQHYIKEYTSGLGLTMDTIRFVDSVLKLTSDDKIMCKALVNVLKVAPRPETEVAGPIPDTYLSQTHRKLLTALLPLCHHYPNLHWYLQSTIEQSMFTFTKEVIPIEVLLNLTQFYLAIINNPNAGTNPARLFICKCLYFFNVKAIPMIYYTLCVYPTVLPQKIDSTYDRSDILISTIQSILMSTYYDPEKCDFMTRQILAKLRMFYNYESFKPPRDEVIENMMAKIRAGRFKNVSYALSLICKRMEQPQTEKFILNERLMPLANEFYHTLSHSSEDDEKIACVLECISFVIKPFNVNTDISQYANLFGRFLNAATERKVVQEAAVAAILRTARFGFVQCFNAIYNFKPTYELSETLKLMLRSFVYKKGKVFLKALEQQAQELLAT